MEQRLATALQRIGQADSMLRDRGEDPEPFLLIYSMGSSREIDHPAWDISWPVPTAEDVDDLEELGLVRTDPETNVTRKFSLTTRGRQQGAALARPSRRYSGGRAPRQDEVLDWLIELERESPENFDLPTRLLDRAVSLGVIAKTGREQLAKRIVALADQGFLDGDLPDLDQVTAEQRLGMSEGLELTMKARDRPPRGEIHEAPTVNIYGHVVASQIAAGDIRNYVSFGALLDDAEVELDRLENVDESAREDARRLLEVLRGKATSATGAVMTGAGGALLASVIGRLLGLPV